VRKIKFGLKGARNYLWYLARVNLLTALQCYMLNTSVTRKPNNYLSLKLLVCLFLFLVKAYKTLQKLLVMQNADNSNQFNIKPRYQTLTSTV